MNLSLIIGIIIGLVSSKIYKWFYDKYISPLIKREVKYHRRGVLEGSYSCRTTSHILKKETKEEFTAQLEVGEIERSGSRSKIVMISYSPSSSTYKNPSMEEMIRKIVDNSWKDSSEIDWIDHPIEHKREGKIDEILK